ncbi:MAG: hypothetical protein DSY42_04445 [Aquifex sp.]|nr:MAG: hypothetical protein DSY42_04445 [Aquifex sp.]
MSNGITEALYIGKTEIVLKLMKKTGSKRLTKRGYFIGDKLKTLLDIKKISQYRLAKMTGISQGTISDYIRNRHAISPSNLEKIAKALGVPVSYFIEDETSEESINKELYVLFDDLTELLQKLPPEKRRKAIQTFKEQLELMAV